MAFSFSGLIAAVAILSLMLQPKPRIVDDVT
jgi:hypothetical protein